MCVLAIVLVAAILWFNQLSHVADNPYRRIKAAIKGVMDALNEVTTPTSDTNKPI
jgi:hypothetical protein